MYFMFFYLEQGLVKTQDDHVNPLIGEGERTIKVFILIKKNYEHSIKSLLRERLIMHESLVFHCF